MPTLELDGRRVTYDEAGPTRARPERGATREPANAAAPPPPLLLLHGFTGGRGDFAKVLATLGEDRRVLAVDLPGHGGSDGPDDAADYALGAVAGWVGRFGEALGLAGYHLLGHSLGGLVAQRVAAAHSDRLASLVLTDTGLGALRETEAEQVVRVALAARDEGPDAALAASLAGREPPPDREHEALRRRFRGLKPEAVVGGARNLVTALPLQAFLRGIDVPVLVVHGADDEVWTPGEQRLLAATAAGAEHVVVPGAGHSPQRENPDAWAWVVRGFLRRVDAGSGPGSPQGGRGAPGRGARGGPGGWKGER